MKPEKILQSNILDIVFENRNKAYGAYELRNMYNNRMTKSIVITSLIVLLFAVSQSFKVPVKHGKVVVENLPALKFTEVSILKEEVKPTPKTEVKKIQKQQAAEAAHTKPEIVKDNLATNTMTEVAKLDSLLIGTKEIKGEAITTEVAITREVPTNGNAKETIEPVVVTESNTPLVIAEFMPEFPGGKGALVKFLQNNLRQPTDFEDGEKVTVIASFVVNKEGEITGVKITQKGRSDLDGEVTRVINKMPRWKPGSQNGRSVAVYYRIPVTFVAAE